MLQHILGSAIGGIVTYLILIVTRAQAADQYLPAVVIGAIAAMLWPWVIAFFLARRVKNRRDEQIQKEVDKQISEQK